MDMSLYENELKKYRQLNTVAQENGVVLFGSTFAKNIPVGELKQGFGLDCNIYNRSLTDLSVFDAAGAIEDCIVSLSPDKVLLQLGETDLERGFKSVSEIVGQYERLICQIKSQVKGCNIVLISVCDEDGDLFPEELNARIKEVAEKTGCAYADISQAMANDAPNVKAFCLLKRFIRSQLTGYEALNMKFA